MSSQPPSKRLEITLISGQDLPPIARNLTTYAVVFLKPDHKLTTQIDQTGHTNPKWNHKFVFNLDRNFSNSDTTTTVTVTFEIYSVGWLRDFLVGSAQVILSNLVEKKNHRPITVQLRRPTGILQGVLNIGVDIIDRSKNNIGRNFVSNIGFLENGDRKMNEKRKLERSRSERTAKFEDFSLADEGGDIGGDGDRYRPVLSRSKSGCSVTEIGSVNSMMRPLPSEVMAALKDGMYSTVGDDVGSYVFGGGAVEREPRDDEKGLNAMVAKWRLKAANSGRTPVVDGRKLRASDHHQQRKKGGRGVGGGLFSCFGNIKGREFSFICGGNEPVKRKKRKPNHGSNPRDK